METSQLHELCQADATDRMAVLIQQQTQFLAFLHRRLGNAADVLQTAYLKAVTAVETVREEEKIVAWFYRLLRNVLTDRHRHHGAMVRLHERLIHETPGVTEPEEDLYHAVCQCVLGLTQTLQPAYREILQQVALEEASLGQVAAALAITPNNASVRLHRARQALHTLLVQMCGACSDHGRLDCTCRRGPPRASPPA